MADAEKSERVLTVYDIKDYESFGNQPKQLTVCLIALNYSSKLSALIGLVDGAIKIGCNFFITWGDAAQMLHDELDDIIEDRKGAYLQIVTMSQSDETANDVAWFLVNAAFPHESALRCCIVTDKAVTQMNQLIIKVQEEVSNYNLSHSIS
jgi:hypothetical protein